MARCLLYFAFPFFSESSKLMNIHKLGEVYLISCFVLKRTCETFVYNNNNTTSSKTFKIWVVQNAQVLIIVAPQTITYHVRIYLLKMCHNKRDRFSVLWALENRKIAFDECYQQQIYHDSNWFKSDVNLIAHKLPKKIDKLASRS